MVLLFSCLLCTATHTDRSWNRRQAQGDQDVINSQQLAEQVRQVDADCCQFRCL